MHRYWDSVIKPVLEKQQVSNIVEIGCLYGDNTWKLAEYCQKKDGILYAIDPFPKFDENLLMDKYGASFKLFKDLSLSVLPNIDAFEAILIDGDHNWYTVFNELKILEHNFKEHFPIVFIHDVGWPYARRDLYYNPENIPPIFRQPYKKAGISPTCHSLTDENGINEHLFNAIYENNLKNGVLTAVEDFIDQSYLEFEFFLFSGFNGLGILVHSEYKELIEFINEQNILISSKLITALEMERIEQSIKLNTAKKEKEKLKRDNKQLVIKLNEISRQLGVPSSENNDIESIQIHIRHLLDEITSLQKDNKKLTENKHKLFENNLELKNEVSNLKKQILENNEFDQQNNHLTNKLKEMEKELSTFKINAHTEKKQLEQRVQAANRASNVHLNSIRYQLGDILINSITSPSKFIRLPGSLFKLVARARKKRNGNTAIEQNIPKVESTRQMVEPKKVTSNNELVESSNQGTMESFFNQLFTSIIVPVYNAADDFINCIESIERHTVLPYKIIIVNDCSTDPRIEQFLETKTKLPNYLIINNETNLGYVESVNIGMRNSTSDVILLNSDTIVTAGWLEKLKYAAYSIKRVGTVTPLSNAAGAFSVPSAGEVNEIPKTLGIDGMAKLVEDVSERVYPIVPTGNGFCIYIKRELINSIGLMDSIRFKRGYGEENDFCMRALKAGWKHIIDDATYIYHKRSASFSEEKKELIKRNRAVLNELHPEYTAMVKEAFESEKLLRIRNNVKFHLKDEDLKFEKTTKKVLYVLHDGSGGTPNTNKDLMTYVESEYECFVLISNKRSLTLYKFKDKSFQVLNTWDLKEEWEVTHTSRDDFSEIYFEVLLKWNISLVHIRHLLAHTFDIAYLANRLGRKLILSFHDFYYVCPTIHLLDNNNNYCGGRCTEGTGVCSPPSSWIPNPPTLKHNWVLVWRGLVQEMFKVCDAFVTTSKSTKDVYTTTFPMLKEYDFRVIEHGRDDLVEFTRNETFHERPVKGKPIKILIPGNIGLNKGSEFIKDLKNIDTENRLEFHFLGNIQSSLKEYGIDHGSYHRHEFYDRVKAIKPSFIGIFSIWPETYCHTLTEAWQCEIPVLATKLGAVEERVNETGCGWFIDYRNPNESYKKIIELSIDHDGYDRMLDRLKKVHIKTAKDMSKEYLELYKGVSLKTPMDAQS